MKTITINTTPKKLLAFRADKNKEIYMDYEDSKLYFYINTDDGFILKAYIPNPNMYKHLFQYMNKPVRVEELMVKSHNFSDSTTWADSNTPNFVLTPYDGYKLYVNSIVTRFPENVDLSKTPLTFTIYKYIPEYGASYPVVQDVYTDSKEFLVQSNSPWSTITFDNPAMFSGTMIEVKFRYANSDTSDWSKLSLSSARDEILVCSLGGTGQLVDTNNNPLVDPVYAIFNTKRVIEF